MEDLKDKLVLQLGVQIKQVRRFKGDIPWEIDPKSFFCGQALTMLLLGNLLVILFRDTGFQHCLISTLDKVLCYFVKELQSLFDKNEGVARYDACWRAFQFELALEELFYGCLCPRQTSS